MLGKSGQPRKHGARVRRRTGVALNEEDLARVEAIRATLQEGTSFNAAVRECIRREFERIQTTSEGDRP